MLAGLLITGAGVLLLPKRGEEFSGNFMSQEEMALDPDAHLERCPWGLGCPTAEPMAVSWVGFCWRKVREETV